MKLIENAGPVLLKSYTTWMAVVTAVLVGVEAFHAQVVDLLPLLSPFLSEGVAAKLAGLTAMLIPLVRVIRQASIAVTSTVDATMDHVRKRGGV
jgi:hypothetical protein